MSRTGGGSPSSVPASVSRSSRSRYSIGPLLAKAFERVGVCCHHPAGSSRDTVAVRAPGDVVTHGATGRILHGDAFGLGALAERFLLVLGEPQRHRHAEMVSH